MGMTDRQFDSDQSRLLKILEIALKEVEETGNTTQLKEIIETLRKELNRP